MEVVNISANSRAQFGTTGAKSVRKEGAIPCVMYGGGENVHFSVTPKSVKSLIYTSDFKLAGIDINGGTHKCFIKAIQVHPMTDEIIHIDFMKLIDGATVKLEVPIKCVGDAPGEKIGGKLQLKLRRVKIKTLAEKIVDKMEVDVSKLELGDSVRVRDIIELEGIEILNADGIPVASVETPRALRSAEAEEEEEDGAAVAEGDGEGEGEAPAAE